MFSITFSITLWGKKTLQTIKQDPLRCISMLISISQMGEYGTVLKQTTIYPVMLTKIVQSSLLMGGYNQHLLLNKKHI